MQESKKVMQPSPKDRRSLRSPRLRAGPAGNRGPHSNRWDVGVNGLTGTANKPICPPCVLSVSVLRSAHAQQSRHKYRPGRRPGRGEDDLPAGGAGRLGRGPSWPGPLFIYSDRTLPVLRDWLLPGPVQHQPGSAVWAAGAPSQPAPLNHRLLP